MVGGDARNLERGVERAEGHSNRQLLLAAPTRRALEEHRRRQRRERLAVGGDYAADRTAELRGGWTS